MPIEKVKSPGPAHGAGATDGHPASRLVVIIPTLNEVTALPATLEAVRQEPGALCIVSDGGSTDGTPEVATQGGATVISTPPGRAEQMNAAVSAMPDVRDWLLFLHADTRLPAGYAQSIADILSRPSVAAGAFTFGIDGQGPAYRLMERLVHFRSTFMQCPYGDQALFMTVDTFRQVGGFANLPVMEDLDLVIRLKQRGRIAIANRKVVTSARRFESHGFLRTTATHLSMLLAFRCGVSPHRMAGWRGPSE